MRHILYVCVCVCVLQVVGSQQAAAHLLLKCSLHRRSSYIRSCAGTRKHTASFLRKHTRCVQAIMLARTHAHIHTHTDTTSTHIASHGGTEWENLQQWPFCNL